LRLGGWLALLGCLVCCASFSASATVPRRVGSQYDLNRFSSRVKRTIFVTNTFHERGDFGAAADAWRELLEEFPGEDHTVLRCLYGGDLAQAGDLPLAMAQFQAATDLDSLYQPAWLNLGNVAYELEQFDVAGGGFRQAYRLAVATEPALLYYAAVSFTFAEKRDAALLLLEELIAGDLGEPEFAWYQLLMSILLEKGELEQAETTAMSMLAREKGDPRYWDLAYRVAAAAGDYRLAAVRMTVMGYLKPLRRDEKIQLGDLYQAIAAPAQAYTYYGQALADSSGADVLKRLAAASLAAYEIEASEGHLVQAIELAPTAALWEMLGDSRFMAEKFQEAYDAYSESADADPRQGRCYLMMAYCALEQSNVSGALTNLEQATAFEEQFDLATGLIEQVGAIDLVTHR
jgi:hypothetical protein